MSAVSSLLTPPHASVMLGEVLAAMAPVDGEVYLDGTLGAGGYTEGLLSAADCHVIGVDRDKTALDLAGKRLARFGDRFISASGCFSDMDALARGAGFDFVNGVMLDIGVSSMQIDQAERGFSFRFDGALDMRMDQDANTETAADVVNTYDADDLADIFYMYGEERKSRRVAAAIVSRRAEERFDRTIDLADVVRGAIGGGHHKIDPATRVFQALRIFVNKELDELSAALEKAEGLLADGGRLVVVSFHSLEDRIVKRFLKERSNKVSRGSRHLPDLSDDGDPPAFIMHSNKAALPTEEEKSRNPRARSAKLRSAVRQRSASHE